MEQSPETRTLRDYLRVLRARRRLIIATTLLAAGAALLLALAREPVYEATATISFTADFNAQNQSTIPGIGGAEGAVSVTRNDVLKATSHDLDDEFTPEELRDRLQATATPGLNVVSIKATGDSGEEAASIANSVATNVQDVLQAELQRTLRTRAAAATDAESAATLRAQAKFVQPVELVNPADVPEAPTSPKPIRDAFFAGLLGLALGLGAAFVRHALDRRFTDPKDIQARLGSPLVGQIRASALGQAVRSDGETPINEDDLEAFRILRSNTEFLAGDEHLRIVAVTSPLAEEGKSTVAAWYAYASALAGRRTVLIECDLRRPALAERLDLKPAPGLSEYLLGEAKPREVLRSVSVDGPTAESLALIPGGLSATQPAEMLASERFVEFIEQVSKPYDLVILDCPPLLPVGDTREILPHVDAVLLCIRIGQTTRDEAAAAATALGRLPDRPVGVVITGLEQGDEGDYYGYYPIHAEAGSPRSA
jgi:capsular exopolysaccharide synthesis family protein